MSKRHHSHARRCARRMAELVTAGPLTIRRCRWALRRRRQPLPVVVLIADTARRRSLERELRRGLARMQAVLGASLPEKLAIIVQQLVTTDRQLAGCYQLGQRPDGSRFTLMRLALQVNGRPLTTDELLAVLAEQCIGVLTQQSPSVLVPVAFEPVLPSDPRPLTPLRPDPLALHPKGTAAEEQTA